MAASNDDSIHFRIISTSIFVISFFGIIGNLHVILAIWKFAELRTKNGLLLCILACHHCICLAFETLSGIRMLLGPSMTRTQCFCSIFVYIFCINYQTCLVLVLVCDIAFCMLRPLKYHTTRISPYVHLVQIPCYIFSFTFLVIGFVTMDEQTVLACNPPLSYSPLVNKAWNTCYLLVCASTVAIYGTTLVYTICCGGFSRLSSSNMSAQTIAAQKRIVKSLSALLVIFCLSWFLGALAPRLAMLLRMDPKLIVLVQTYAVIPAILSYAQTYYIYFCVSHDYREAFRKIGFFGLLRRRDRGRNSQIVHSSSEPVCR